MNRKLTITLSTTFAFLVLSGTLLAVVWLLFPPSTGASGGVGNTGYLRRYAANFITFGAPAELVTVAPPAPGAQGGTVIYDKNIFVADDINTLYVTISAVGDTHNGARLQIACNIDNAPCNPGPNPVGGAPNGWLTIQRHKDYNNNYTGVPFSGDGGGGAGDLHDNGVHYTWCAPFETKAGLHNVKVRFASAPAPGDPASAGAPVFLEAVHFYVDGARVADEAGRCAPVALPTMPGTTALGVATAEAGAASAGHHHEK